MFESFRSEPEPMTRTMFDLKHLANSTLVSQPKLKILRSFNIALIREMGAAFHNFCPKLPEMVTR